MVWQAKLLAITYSFHRKFNKHLKIAVKIKENDNNSIQIFAIPLVALKNYKIRVLISLTQDLIYLLHKAINTTILSF